MHRLAFGTLIIAAGAMAPALPQAPSAPASKQPAAPQVASPAAGWADDGLAAPLSAAQVIDLLNSTIDWYRTLGIQQQAADEPSDVLFLNENRQTAARIVALAFEVARADADALAKQTAADGQPTGDDKDPMLSSAHALQATLAAQTASVRQQLESERRELGRRAGKARTEIEARINELQGELDLVETKRSIISTIIEFATTANSAAGDLKGQIDAMAVAIPGAGLPGAGLPGAGLPGAGLAGAGVPGAGTPAAGSASIAASSAATPTPGGVAPVATLLGGAATPVARFGLWEQGLLVYRLSTKAGTIAAVERRTADLQAIMAGIRDPLVDRMKRLSAGGDALAVQSNSADAAALNRAHDRLDALAAEFKQAAALLIPLSRENVLLVQYRRNLGTWRAAIESQYRGALRTLGVRASVVLVLLALVLAAGQVWRRAVMRYVQDSRRRYQLLLLRRIALWSLIVIVVGISFASELGSIVTFAGLITAGIAVAMQSVLVSIVGYFFLIGKYGIRVGDRVQIGEVAGEVIDLGLVRMYLMELGKGALHPTGRVVGFANSVVFQVSSGLFKQIPGVNVTWREVDLNLPVGADHAVLKERLQSAVVGALAAYRPEILRQTQEIARTTVSGATGGAEPQVQLRYSGGAVTAHVRYPVHLEDAAEIDERVTEALARALSAAGAPATGLPAHAE